MNAFKILPMLIAFTACSQKRPEIIRIDPSVNNTETMTDEKLENSANHWVNLTGVVKKEIYASKKGPVKNKFEYWLYLSGRNKRVLLNIPQHDASIEIRVDKKTTLKGFLFYGNIDETDSQKQSRHGYRLDQVTIIQ